MSSVTKLNTILDYMKKYRIQGNVCSNLTERIQEGTKPFARENTKLTVGENKLIYSIKVFKMFFVECYYTNDITFDSAK